MTGADAAVAAAMATLDGRYYRYDGDAKLQQTSSLPIMACLAAAADVSAGMCVLEVGTGSGYTGALLSQLVGPTGRVTSLDIDGALTDRARRLHLGAGRDNIVVLCADGYAGHAAGGPYDRVLAWACPPELPRSWLDQCAPGAVVVTPLPVSVATRRSLTFVIDADAGTPQVRSVIDGSFVGFHGPAGFDVSLLATPATVTLDDTPDRYTALAAPALGRQESLDALRSLDAQAGTHLLGAPNDWLRWWVLASAGDFPADGAVGDGEPVVGLARPGSVAVVSLVTGGLRTTGSCWASRELAGIAAAWVAAGRPGPEALRGTLCPTPGGWDAQISIRQA